MKKILLLLFLAPLLMATTCDDDDYQGSPCTEEARAGLIVSVSLNGDSNVTADGITITARDGNYTEDLFPNIPHTPQFSGAYERPGNYIITARKEGYQTYTSNVINVKADRCHIIPIQLSVDLVPLP